MPFSMYVSIGLMILGAVWALEHYAGDCAIGFHVLAGFVGVYCVFRYWLNVR